jgi:acyl dehydratase
METKISKYVQQRGLYFDELETGVVYRHSPGRTIGEADNTLFSTLTMNPAAIHLDAVSSAEDEFGQRIVNSLLTLSVLVGVSVGHLTLGTTVANLGFSEVSFPRPVFHGDTLICESEVVEMRESRSRPEQGIVTFEHRAYNQDGTLVAVARRAALMLHSPSETGSGR